MSCIARGPAMLPSDSLCFLCFLSRSHTLHPDLFLRSSILRIVLRFMFVQPFFGVCLSLFLYRSSSPLRTLCLLRSRSL